MRVYSVTFGGGYRWVQQNGPTRNLPFFEGVSLASQWESPVLNLVKEPTFTGVGDFIHLGRAENRVASFERERSGGEKASLYRRQTQRCGSEPVQDSTDGASRIYAGEGVLDDPKDEFIYQYHAAHLTGLEFHEVWRST